MLIEQNIEFISRGSGPLVVHVYLLQLVIIMTKQKSRRKIFKWIIIYRENIAPGYVPCFELPAPNHFQNLTPKCKILNVFWG